MRGRDTVFAWTLALAASAGCAQPQGPRIEVVQPSGPQVPSSLLRLSVRFAGPVQGGVLPHLSLRHVDGTSIAEPFLEQELWSPDGRTLTILLHPGRVKTDLRAHVAMGPVLAEGDDVALALDGRVLRRWHVGPPDESGPAPSAWSLSPVHAGTREALVVTLDAPIDGQDTDYLAIADEHGRRVPGRARLADGEGRWSFVPDRPWRSRSYRLMVRGTLEDASGNRVGSRFETSLAAPAGAATDVAIPFAPDVSAGRRAPRR